MAEQYDHMQGTEMNVQDHPDRSMPMRLAGDVIPLSNSQSTKTWAVQSLKILQDNMGTIHQPGAGDEPSSDKIVSRQQFMNRKNLK